MEMMTLNTNEEMTMTSLEIAEFTGKQHKNVMRDIRKMLENLEINGGSYLSTQNYINRGTERTREIFALPKDIPHHEETFEEKLLISYYRKGVGAMMMYEESSKDFVHMMSKYINQIEV